MTRASSARIISEKARFASGSTVQTCVRKSDVRCSSGLGAITAVAAMLAGIAAPASAQRESNSLPVVIADQRALVGRYHFEEKDGSDLFKVDVALNADGSAVYAVKAGDGDGGGIRAEGFWTVRDDVIHIHNRPGPVSLEQAGPPTRDPKVALSITATLPDGSPATGLGVTWPGAMGLYILSEGRHDAGIEEGAVLGQVTISRAQDDRELASFVMKPGSPNSYRFIYHPSNVEPFDFSAIALDPGADMIEVELGTASAKLRRVRN